MIVSNVKTLDFKNGFSFSNTLNDIEKLLPCFECITNCSWIDLAWFQSLQITLRMLDSFSKISTQHR
jgi:hypothetical protein